MNEPVHVSDAAFEKTVLTIHNTSYCRFLGTLVHAL